MKECQKSVKGCHARRYHGRKSTQAACSKGRAEGGLSSDKPNRDTLSRTVDTLLTLFRGGTNVVIRQTMEVARWRTPSASLEGLTGRMPAPEAAWRDMGGHATDADKQKVQDLISQQRINLADVKYLDLDGVESILDSFVNPQDKTTMLLYVWRILGGNAPPAPECEGVQGVSGRKVPPHGGIRMGGRFVYIHPRTTPAGDGAGRGCSVSRRTVKRGQANWRPPAVARRSSA